MLIDVHAHIGHSTPGIAPPARVATYAGVCGVDYVLVSNGDAALDPPGAADLDETDANVACLAASRAHPRLLPVYWVRPGRADSHVPALAGALASEPFVAVTFCPARSGFDAADRLLDRYLAAVAAARRPALFCIGTDERAAPAKVYEAARRHPRLPVVLCHCGRPQAQRAAGLDVVRHACQRADANLYLDTSHAGADGIRAVVRAVGADRVLFGTDAPSHGDAHIPRHLALLEELRQTLPPQEFQQVTSGNAMRLFSLPQRAPA